MLQLFNGGSSLFLDNLAVTLTNGLTWIPLYLALFYIVVKNNETMNDIFETMTEKQKELLYFMVGAMAEEDEEDEDDGDINEE